MREVLEAWARSAPSNFIYDSIRTNPREGSILLRKPLSAEKRTLMRGLVNELRANKEVRLGLSITKQRVCLWVIQVKKRKKRGATSVE